MHRRSLLAVLGAAAGMSLAGRAGGAERRVERLGLQLYTVREPLARDPTRTLAAVAEAGYVEVETAGYADLPPAKFAAALTQAGLRAPSAHVPLELIESAPARLLDAAAVLGHRFLVLPSLGPLRRASLAHYQGVADTLNAFGAQCAAAGVQLAYHNHDFEFAPIDGVRPYDLLLRRCDPGLVKFELDLFWASKAGADPAALLRTAPERFPLCHVKDMDQEGRMVDVGQGTLDFATLFAAGSGLSHYFVEHDRPDDPLASIRRSAASLRDLRY